MQTVDLTPLVQPLIAILGTVLTAVAAALGKKLHEWLEAHVQNAKLRSALERTAAFVGAEVKAISQTLVPAIKAAAADGKISPEEAKGLRDKALEGVKGHFGPDGLKELGQTMGITPEKVEAFLVSQIEASVAGQKS